MQQETIPIYDVLPIDDTLPIFVVGSVAHEETAQLKFLFAAPEQIWACLERHGYLEAAQHFLLARHIYSQLGVGVAAGPAPTMARTPAMLQRMWQSVAGFKEVILEVCECVHVCVRVCVCACARVCESGTG